jgi:hypothetical protein
MGWSYWDPHYDPTKGHTDTEHLCNPHRISLCDPERRKKCEKEKTCTRWHLGWTGELDTLLRENGYEPSKGGLLTGREKDWKIAKRLLREVYLKGCVPWVITVQEQPMPKKAGKKKAKKK